MGETSGAERNSAKSWAGKCLDDCRTRRLSRRLVSSFENDETERGGGGSGLHARQAAPPPSRPVPFMAAAWIPGDEPPFEGNVTTGRD